MFIHRCDCEYEWYEGNNKHEHFYYPIEQEILVNLLLNLEKEYKENKSKEGTFNSAKKWAIKYGRTDILNIINQQAK